MDDPGDPPDDDREAGEGRPGRPGRPAKRGLVLDAGVAEFLAEGYAGATLASIAARAGVSTATVFKHFRTKADLFGAIMGRVFGMDDAAPELPVALDPGATLRAAGLAYAATLSEPRIRALFRVVIAEVPRFPELGRELYEKGKRPYLDRLEAALAAHVAAGNLAIDDPPLAARQFLGMINDVVFWPHQLVVDLPEADAPAVVEAAVRVFLRAYAPAPAPVAG
jgi:AcrR family transcriptional regulator